MISSFAFFPLKFARAKKLERSWREGAWGGDEASYAHAICYSYTIALSGLFELYARGGCLNHEAKPSGLNACLEHTIQ